MARTEPGLAEQAKERAIKAHPNRSEFWITLCPACHEPFFCEDPNPSDFVHDPDVGEYGLDRAAFQISPADILELDPDNPWDRICVYPDTIERDDGTHTRVAIARHDFSAEDYEAWAAALEELKDVERRAEQNQGLDDFQRGGE